MKKEDAIRSLVEELEMIRLELEAERELHEKTKKSRAYFRSVVSSQNDKLEDAKSVIESQEKTIATNKKLWNEDVAKIERRTDALADSCHQKDALIRDLSHKLEMTEKDYKDYREQKEKEDFKVRAKLGMIEDLVVDLRNNHLFY